MQAHTSLVPAIPVQPGLQFDAGVKPPVIARTQLDFAPARIDAPALPVSSRHRRRRLSLTLVGLADVGAVCGVSLLLRGNTWVEACLAFAVWIILGLHRPKFTLSVLNDLPRLGYGCLGAGVAALALQAQTVAQALLAGTALLLMALAARAAAYWAVRRLRRAGTEAVPVVVLGCGPTSETLIERIAAHPEMGMQVVAQFGGRVPRAASTAPFCGPLEAMPDALAAHPARRVIVCEGDEPPAEVVEAIRRSRRSATTVDVVPALHHLHALERAGDEVWGLPLIRLCRPRHVVLARGFKRALDVTVAAGALVLALPLLAIVVVGVRLELGRGIFFCQERVGLHGRRFRLVKFRSIPTCAHAEGRWSVSGFDEIGPVGRFIRKYSLDELPQLWNVLRGDMSLVGPRPERPEYVEKFSAEVPGYRHRHRMPVGLTGLAAVRGLRGGATSITERAHFDNLYIETWSFWLDLKIVFLTVRSVLRGTGG